MKFSRFLIRLFCSVALLTASMSAQTAIRTVSAVPPASPEEVRWLLQVFFDAVGTARIGEMFMRNLNTNTDIPLERNFKSTPTGIDVFTINKIDPVNNTSYMFFVKVTNIASGTSSWLSSEVVPLNIPVATNAVIKAKAKSADDADVYISGEINGANKKKTGFTTEISLRRFKKVAENTFVTPFFKLNASTDADADPDSMEFGASVRRRFNGTKNFTSGFFDVSAKIESERDFQNTNLLVDPRLTLLPFAFPKGLQNKLKVFFRPFIGIELGKNLRSPLKAAEGNAVVRPLAGAKLRFNYPVNEDEDREINWETTYTRRWLLKNELGFETDDDNNLVLTKFGKSPRDYVQSKFSYGLAKFFDAFIAYDWGQVPPSYKLVDHRFRLGFAYKFKFAVR